MVLHFLAVGLGVDARVSDRDRELDRELAQERQVLLGRRRRVQLRENDHAQGLSRAAKRKGEHPLDQGPRPSAPFLGHVLGFREGRIERRHLFGRRDAGDPLPHDETRTPPEDGRVAEGPGKEHLGARVQDPEGEFGEAAGAQQEVAGPARQLVPLQERQLARGAHEELEPLLLAHGAAIQRDLLVHRVRRFARPPVSDGLWISARKARSSLGPR